MACQYIEIRYKDTNFNSFHNPFPTTIFYDRRQSDKIKNGTYIFFFRLYKS